MARARRSQLATANFDGLTDVVTNLAGTLILLVVLVLGITTEARPRLPAGVSSGEKTARPVEPLLRQIQVVQLEIQSVDGQIRRIEQGMGELESRIEALRDEAPALPPREDLPDAQEGSFVEHVHGRRQGQHGLVGVARPLLQATVLLLGRLSESDAAGAAASPSASRLVGLIEEGIQRSDLAISDMEDRMSGLEDRIKDLLRQAEAIRPPEEKPSRDPEPKAARELRYRPPIEQRTRQQTLLFCCWEGEIRSVDVGAIDEAFIRRRLSKIAKSDSRSRGRETFEFPLPGTKFLCQGFVEGEAGTPGLRTEWMAVLNPAALDKGESDDRAGKPGSRFQQVLGAHQPGRCCLLFAVWPDSFDAYRSARAIAWEAGYDVGWHPIESGEPLRVQPGLSLID